MVSMQRGNVVALFGSEEAPSYDPASPVHVVRTLADATSSLGKVAELIDAGALDADTKLALIRGVQDLVVRAFDLNSRYMQASGLTRLPSR